MNHIVEIRHIIDGALKLNRDKVLNYTKLLIERLNEKGDIKAAESLSRLISDQNYSFLQTYSINSQPPKESDSGLELLTLDAANNKIMPVLSSEVYERIKQFVLLKKQESKLLQYNQMPINSLLLFGPPGCGKNMTASLIAKELNLPLYIARLDAIVSSFLGSTAKNLRRIFEFVSNQPCILLLDEFDAIAKKRDDKDEVGELKRVVNSLIQNLDSLPSSTIVIAATNHQALLDPAIWRRFEYRIHIGLPTQKEIHKLLEMLITDKCFNVDKYAVLFDGFTPAEIYSVVNRSRIFMIINDEENISEAAFIRSFIDEYFMKLGNIPSQEEQIITLKKNFDKVFTYQLIKEIYGMSEYAVRRILNVK